MRCRKCGIRYSLDRTQPAPGGSSSPGYFFWFGLALVAAAAVLYQHDRTPWHWVALAVGVLTLLKVPIAHHDCTRRAEPGNACPRCGTVNRAYWWSV